MKNKNKKFIPVIDVIVIMAFTVYVLLDTFVIPRTYAVVDNENTGNDTIVNTSSSENGEESEDDQEDTSEDTEETAEEAVITDNSYTDENISIVITEYEYEGTAVYVADVQVSSAEYLKTAFASAAYGKNVTAKNI